MTTAARPRGPRTRKVAPPTLLDAAQSVFSSQGLAGATIRAIARKAGCDPALIYYHYENKEALFLALILRRLPPLAAQLTALASPFDERACRDRIWSALESFQLHLGDDAGFRSLFRGQLIEGSNAIKDLVAEHLRPVISAMRSILQQGIERGELREDLDLTTTTFFIARMHMEILDLVPNMAPRLVGLPSGDSLNTTRKAWLDFLWRAIASHPPT
jgi:AcrR family transcriptional regulator